MGRYVDDVTYLAVTIVSFWMENLFGCTTTKHGPHVDIHALITISGIIHGDRHGSPGTATPHPVAGRNGGRWGRSDWPLVVSIVCWL
jgi:hypothetical protein